MMKALFTVNALRFELAAESARDLFQTVAQIQEIFEAETACGLCQSDDIRYSYREAGEYKFYELLCRHCGGQFRFGQKKKSLDLFPKRTDDGKPLPNGGWSKYEPRGGDDEDSRAPRPPARPASAPASNGSAIPEFADVDEAERSQAWRLGKPVRIAGVLYHVPNGRRAYEEAPKHAQAK